MGSTLNGVEIFRAGKWNGDTYTVADLDAMVAAFPAVGFRPPVKLGHDKTPGARAFGWITALRRVGDKLVADFSDVPEAVMRTIRERGLDTVSAEIFWNFQRGGQMFRRVLKAVALLGAEIPAVSGLAPLRSVVHALSGEHMYSAVKSYEFAFSGGDPGEQLDRLVKQTAFERGLTYQQAWERVLASPDHAALKTAYAATQGTPYAHEQQYSQAPQDAPQRLGDDVADLIAEYRQMHPQLSYAQALRVVLQNNPRLMRDYGAVTNGDY